jgi:hypothetical protein
VWVASAIITLIVDPSFSPEGMPVIKATSNMVDIRDGSDFKKKDGASPRK